MLLKNSRIQLKSFQKNRCSRIKLIRFVRVIIYDKSFFFVFFICRLLLHNYNSHNQSISVCKKEKRNLREATKVIYLFFFNGSQNEKENSGNF